MIGGRLFNGSLTQPRTYKTHFFVKKQMLRSNKMASGPPVAVHADHANPTTAPFVRPGQPLPGDNALALRAKQFCTGHRKGLPVLVASELIAALVVDLPAASARQRDALLAYAVEDRVAQPIEVVAVAQGMLSGAAPGQVLALVVARPTLAALVAAAPPGCAAMPEMLLIRRPAPPATGMAWAVWRDGMRAVVRASDGTGFAVSVDMLHAVWLRSGKPVLTSLGAALPTNLPAVDLSGAPPDPDPADLNFRFPVPRSPADRVAELRPLIRVAGIVLAGWTAVLGLALADTIALGRIAVTQRDQAQVALSGILPGFSLTDDVEQVLSRLAPTAAQPRQSAFLPLLAGVSAAMAEAGPGFSLRKLGWAEADNQLILTLQAAALADLQIIERHLADTGFSVSSGAAIAGDGGAEVDVIITGPGE